MSAAVKAADAWMSIFSDTAVVKFSVSAFTLPGGPLGFFDVDPVTSAHDYTDVAAALAFDATSASDFSAVASLQPGPALDMVTQDTTTAPTLRTRYSSPSTFNTTLRLPRAQLKALGILAPGDGGPGADGALKVNMEYFPLFDFDPGDGIDPGKIDLVAVLAHEMAHGMGFLSGVDHIDFASSDGGMLVGPDFPHDYTGEAIFTPLDLYRYTAESIGLPDQPSSGAVLDWGAGSAGDPPADNPYFSIDGGVTPLAMFSTGLKFGDGNQAQHWKDESFVDPAPPLGLMDPDIDTAELGVITAFDVMALDVVGWTLVPEPSSIMLAAWGLAAVAQVARHRRRRA